jgi:predicted outer membrane repeat protein
MSILNVTSTSDSGVGSLRQAIEEAKSGDTIQFSSSLANKTIALSSEIEIDAGKSLTIDGAGASNLTISGSNKTRIIHLDSNVDKPTDLTIKNLTLANGYTGERGGAIATEHKGSVNVENVEFTNNVANKGGGAIDVAWEGNLIIADSRFEGNKATGSNDERGGGAIVFTSPNEFTVTNSDFINNEGINGGAINSLNGKLTLSDSEFIGNKTTAATYASGEPRAFLRGYGGAVYADRASSVDGPGGAIDLNNNVFKDNQGKAAGGAVYLYTAGKDRVSVDGTLFEDNTVSALAGGGEGGDGGALTVMSNEVNRGLTVSNSSFVNNTAALQGGGLWTMNAPGTISNSTFSGNRAESFKKSGVGGGLALYSDTDLTDTTIADNYAGWTGGGISPSSDASVSVKNTIFYNNTADNGNEDWGIQQHTSKKLIDKGNNIQYPPKQTENFNDYNVTDNVKLVDPKLSELQNAGDLLVYNLSPGSTAAGAGASANGVATASTTKQSVASSNKENADRFSGGANDILSNSNGNDDALTGNASANRLVFNSSNSQTSLNTDASVNDDTSVASGGFSDAKADDLLTVGSSPIDSSDPTNGDRDNLLFSVADSAAA